jgi:hypothetical protein
MANQIARSLNAAADRIQAECGQPTDFVYELRVAAQWIIDAEKREAASWQPRKDG